MARRTFYPAGEQTLLDRPQQHAAHLHSMKRQAAATNPKRTARRRAPFAGRGAVLLAIAVAAATPAALAQTPVSGDVTAAPLSPLAKSLLENAQGTDLLRGNGTPLGYVLSHGNIVPGSVRVTLDGAPLAPGAGYSLDAQTGTLTLTRRTARTDQSLVVRYRYQADAAPGGGAKTGAAALPLLTFSGSSGLVGGKNNLVGALGLVRTDDGARAVPLLGLTTGNGASSNSGATGPAGLSGLIYLAAGANSLGSTPRALAGDNQAAGKAPAATPPGASGGAAHLIDQKLALGSGRTQVSIAFQDVSRGFRHFAALKSARAASDADLARLQQERGIQRLGLNGSLALGKSGQFSFGQSTVSASGQGILRQQAALQAGGLSLSANLLRVDKDFGRFADLGAEKDRDALAGFAGGKRMDMAGLWTLGRAFKAEGNLLDLSSPDKTREKNNRLRLSLAPKRGWLVSALSESSQKTDAAGKTSRTSVRAFDFATDPQARLALTLGQRQTTTNAEERGPQRRETITHLGTAARLFGNSPRAFGLSVRGLYENTVLREVAATDKVAAARTTTTRAYTYNLQSAGAGPLRFKVDNKQSVTESDGAPEQRRAARLLSSQAGLRLNKSAFAAYTFSSDVQTIGSLQRTEREKQDASVQLGRGYLLRQFSDAATTVDAAGNVCERRTLVSQFATDPAAPLWASGERRLFSSNDSNADKNNPTAAAAEARDTWKGGLTLGGLSVRGDGLKIERRGPLAQTQLAEEHKRTLLARLPFGGGWTADYLLLDRRERDEKTKQDSDETKREYSAGGPILGGALRLILAGLTYDDRRDAVAETQKTEIAVSSTRPLNLGLLDKTTLTAALGTIQVRDNNDREAEAGRSANVGAGRTRRIALEGLFANFRFGAEYSETALPGKPVIVGKAIRFASDNQKSRLQVNVHLKVRPAPADAGMSRQVVSRQFCATYNLARGHLLSYQFTGNPEKPDGNVEKREAESLTYAAQWGRGARFGATYQRAGDRASNAFTRSVGLSLSGPLTAAAAAGGSGTPLAAYELSYLGEQTHIGDKSGQRDTYVVAYQFQRDTTQIGLAARFVERGGNLPRPQVAAAADEAQAHFEIKMNW